MSLPYTGSHRSSWCLGYTSSPSSTSSLSSRPRSIYGTGSGIGRLDYGSSSYGSTARSDSSNTRTYVSSSRQSEAYTPASSISSRSSSRYADIGSRRPSDTGGFSHLSSGSVREIGARRDSSKSVTSPTSNSNASIVCEHANSLRNSSHSYTGSRSRRNKAGADGTPSSSSTKEDKSNVTPSSSVDDDYSNTKCQRWREIQHKEVQSASNEDKKHSGVEGLQRLASGDNEKKEDTNIEIQKDNSEQQQRKDISRIRSSADAQDEIELCCQKTNSKTKVDTHGTGIERVIQRGMIERTCTSQPVPAQNDVSIREPTRHDPRERAGPSEVTTASFRPSGHVHYESRRQKSVFGVSARTPAESSEVSQCFKSVSSTKTFSRSQLSDGEENVRTDDSSGGQRNSGDIHFEDITRKPRANGSAIKASNINARPTTSTTNSATQAEIIRLESLCESRTKELTHTKMQLRDACQAFDAMAALVKYCCHDLNAFECLPLAGKLETIQTQLTDCLSQIADLNSQKDILEKSLAQIIQDKEEALSRVQEASETIQKEREEHARITREMDDTHNAALTTQRDELTSKHDENVKKFNHFYDRQIDMLRLAHDRQMSDMKNESKLEMNALKISHLEEIQELRNKHDSQMEELHKQHRNKLEDITHRFESIKLTLSEKVESLRGECDDLARRARSSEDALQRDADAKVQIALAPYITLPKEIESLKMVLEMRNEEIQKLRTRNMDIEKQLEEIPIGREKIISLQQKLENLEAIINIKSDHEKQLHEKCQILMRKYDRESRANKRLSMDYEQVVWRMSQSSEFGSCESLTKRHFSRSPPHSKEGSPDSRHRAPSPNSAQSDVVMRVKKRSSHSISEGDRQLRSRSATFVVEKSESSSSHSPSLSPQLKQKRWRKKSQAEEVAAENENIERMCHSAGAEIISDLSGQQKQSEEQRNKLTLKDVSGPHVVSSDDMINSYSRSLSLVSDSGVYDSMTKSDVLDSSIVSTDSEWGTSVNLSMNCDSTLEDLESGPSAGEYHALNDVTVVEINRSLSSTDSDNANINSCGGSSSHQGGSQSQNEDDDQSSCYKFYVTLPQGPGVAGDNVFDEKANMDSC